VAEVGEVVVEEEAEVLQQVEVAEEVSIYAVTRCCLKLHLFNVGTLFQVEEVEDLEEEAQAVEVDEDLEVEAQAVVVVAVVLGAEVGVGSRVNGKDMVKVVLNSSHWKWIAHSLKNNSMSSKIVAILESLSRCSDSLSVTFYPTYLPDLKCAVQLSLHLRTGHTVLLSLAARLLPSIWAIHRYKKIELALTNCMSVLPTNQQELQQGPTLFLFFFFHLLLCRYLLLLPTTFTSVW
jgi:hypothetical protein